jgi:hypothetical protein
MEGSGSREVVARKGIIAIAAGALESGPERGEDNMCPYCCPIRNMIAAKVCCWGYKDRRWTTIGTEIESLAEN